MSRSTEGGVKAFSFLFSFWVAFFQDFFLGLFCPAYSEVKRVMGSLLQRACPCIPSRNSRIFPHPLRDAGDQGVSDILSLVSLFTLIVVEM
jgi:hypothetical protein